MLFQSYFAESNYEYNQRIILVNQYVDNQQYEKALQITRGIENKNIFTNNDIVRMKRNLAIKVNTSFFDSDYKPKSIGDYTLNSLFLLKKKKYRRAKTFNQNGIIENSVSDSLIKLYELVAVNTPNNIDQNQSFVKYQSFTKVRFNEAMNLLDLMKRKEKTLF